MPILGGLHADLPLNSAYLWLACAPGGGDAQIVRLWLAREAVHQLLVVDWSVLAAHTAFPVAAVQQAVRLPADWGWVTRTPWSAGGSGTPAR
jgi:hypothetical protein